MIFPHNSSTFIRYFFFKQLRGKILPLIIVFFGSAVFGQSKIDSLSARIANANSQKEKARLLLERALLYDKNEREKAFSDIHSAEKYFRANNNKIGEIESYIAYGSLHYAHRDLLKAAHFDSLAIQLSKKISYKEGEAMGVGNLGRDFYKNGNFEVAEGLLKQAIKTEKNFKPQNRERLAELYNIFCLLNVKRGDYTRSLFLIEKAVAYAQDINDNTLLTNIYINHANSLSRLARFDEAIKAHYKVIRLSEKNNDTVGLQKTYNNLGIVFRNAGEYDKAITHYRKSLELGKVSKNYQAMGFATVNMATIYSEKEEYSGMDTLFIQGIDYFEKASELAGVAFANHNYGNFLIIMGNYPEAEKRLRKSYEIRKEIGAELATATTLSLMGNLALKQKKWKEAEKYLLASEKIYIDKKIGDRELKELCNYLKELYTEKGNFKKAFEYQTKELELEKTLFTENEKINTLKTEAAYEMEKRDMEMALAKEEQQRNRQRILFISSAIVGLLLFSILFLWFRRRQLKERHGAYVQNLNQQHRLDVTKVLKNAEQQERKKIAHKLHDETGSLLSIAILNVKQLRKDTSNANSSSEQKLETTQKLLVDISENVRNISHTLMPVAFEKQGLKAAIHEFVMAINVSQKIKIEEIIEGLEDTSLWSEEFCLTLYRIVQEVMNNIIKHSQATNVLLQIVELETSVTIYIEDNGKGLDENVAVEGLGLKLLKNNVAYLNGTIEINGQKNKGTFILAELPIEKKDSSK